jgi:hypothetical protein
MEYNYEEKDIINELYNSYLDNKDFNYSEELKLLIFDIIRYNDDANINEIINKYGGIYDLILLYQNKYSEMSLDNLNYYELLAFIGLYDYIYTKITEKIVLDFNLRI